LGIALNSSDGEQLNEHGIPKDLTPYQKDPVGFCERFFGEEYIDDVKALMVSVRDKRYTVARSANAVGKSHGAARLALWFLCCFPRSQVYTAAAPPESNLRNILWGELGELIEKHKDGLLADFKINDLKLTHRKHDKWFLAGVTIPAAGSPQKRQAAFSGKHAPHMLFINDEGDGIPDEVYKGIESCISGGDAHLLVMFNPRHESGIVYRMERDGIANVIEMSAFRHPNVITGEDTVPGAVSRETTVRRINEWTRALAPGEAPDAECFAVPDFLVGAIAQRLSGAPYDPLPAGHRKVEEPAFWHMVLAMYPPVGEGQLISRSWVRAAFARYEAYTKLNGGKPPKIAPRMGLDVAELGQDFNAMCLRYGGYVPPIELWNGVDTQVTSERAADIYHARKCAVACVDGTAVGSGVAPAMEKLGCEAYGVKMHTKPTMEIEEGIFTHMRDQLYWLTRLWLRHDMTAMIAPDDRLEEELICPTYMNIGGKLRVMPKDKMKELLGRSPDRMESLILTFFNEEVSTEEGNESLKRALTKHRGL